MSGQPSTKKKKKNVAQTTQVSIKRFGFFMRYIADNNLWDEVELYLENQGCHEIVVSSEPINAIQKMLKQKHLEEPLSKHGQRVMASGCGVTKPGPPGGPPKHPQ